MKEQLQEQQIPHGPLQIVFTVSEEGGVHGSQHLDRSLLHADYGYTFDTHGHPGYMTYAAPGKNQLLITVRGKAAHAGVEPEKGRSAIIAAAKLLATAPQGRIDEETTCNAGTITGGTAANVVAEECIIHYEARSRDARRACTFCRITIRTPCRWTAPRSSWPGRHVRNLASR